MFQKTEAEGTLPNEVREAKTERRKTNMLSNTPLNNQQNEQKKISKDRLDLYNTVSTDSIYLETRFPCRNNKEWTVVRPHKGRAPSDRRKHTNTTHSNWAKSQGH